MSNNKTSLSLNLYAVILVAVLCFSLGALLVWLQREPEKPLMIPTTGLTQSQEDVERINGRGYFSYFGTWEVVSGEAPTGQMDTDDYITSVEINCWKEWGNCIEAKAVIANGFFQNYIKYYEINSWSQDGKISAGIDFASTCTSEQLELNIKTGVVTHTTYNREGFGTEDCDLLEEPLVFRLTKNY